MRVRSEQKNYYSTSEKDFGESKMKLNMKIFLFLFGLSALAIGIIALSSYAINTSKNEVNDLLNEDLVFLSNTKEVYTQGLQRGQAVRNLILNPEDDKAKENFDAAAGRSLQIVKELIAVADRYGLGKEMSDLKLLTEQDIKIQKQVIEITKGNKEEALLLIKEKETPIWREIKEKYFSTEKEIVSVFEKSQKQTNKDIEYNLMLIYILLALFVGVSIFLFWYMRKIITMPITRLSREFLRLANGDLTIEPMESKTKDEIGMLIRSFNKMILDFRQMVTRVKNSAENVAASSEELMAGAEQTNKATEHIASTMEQLAASTENQVIGVQETSVVINGMTDGLKNIASRANSVSDSSIETNDKSLTGQLSISKVKEQMDLINENVDQLSILLKGLGLRSHEIGKIIEVITDIAAQTNLLALNAAIEAARAGEHGRGFAVVADEVRKLAEQSASSAAQIADLITFIQTETEQAVSSMDLVTEGVGQGLKVVNQAGEAFEQIKESVNGVAGQLQEIAAEVQELSQGTSKVIYSMDTVSRIVEENSAGSQSVSAAAEEQLASMEEISSSAVDLSNMAEELNQTIGEFKV